MIFRYPGGKSKKSVKSKILERAPSCYVEYREPFVGGGGIFFALSKNVFSHLQYRWINDIDAGLIAVYQALKERPTDFIESCRDILPAQPGEEEVYPKESSTGKTYNKRLKEKFDELLADKSVDPALRYFFVNRTVWAGRVNYDLESRLYFSNPEGWNIISTKKLERAARLLKSVKITCQDYAELLSCPGKDVWIYCDPPYMRDTKLVAGSKLYAYNFTMEDHKQFAQRINECEHNVCVSYDDEPEVRKLFADKKFRIHEVSWKYSGSSMEQKVDGQELIITNYEE